MGQRDEALPAQVLIEYHCDGMLNPVKIDLAATAYLVSYIS